MLWHRHLTAGGPCAQARCTGSSAAAALWHPTWQLTLAAAACRLQRPSLACRAQRQLTRCWRGQLLSLSCSSCVVRPSMPTLHVLICPPGTCRRRRCCQSSLGQATVVCLCRLSLHALVFGNLRAVAFLWGRFVRELRFSHWETLTPLPRMPGADVVAAHTHTQT